MSHSTQKCDSGRLIRFELFLSPLATFRDTSLSLGSARESIVEEGDEPPTNEAVHKRINEA